jgi:hypothetical protein
MRETEPKTIVQGEKLEWTRSFCDHPATLWTLQYRFRGPGTGFDASASADDTAFITEVAATVTTAMDPGKYEWQAWVTEIADATNKVMIDSGSVTVKKGFASGSAGVEVDLRSAAKIMLDTLDAALLASGTADVIEYELTTPAGGRRVKRSSRTEVLTLRKYYAGIVARENAKERIRNGGKFGKQILVRMREQ